MVSPKDQELLRESHGPKLTASQRANIFRPYLPDPTDLARRPAQPQQHQQQRQQQQRRRRIPRKTPIRTFLRSQFHQLVYTLIHIFFGIAVRLVQTYHAVVDRIFAIVYHHHRTPELIRKDVKGLKRLPEHLTVVLGLKEEDDALGVLMDEVAELTAWTACSGVPVLSVYERTGILKSCIPSLHKTITRKLSSYYGSPSQQPLLHLFAPHHPVYNNPQTDSTPRSNSSAITLLLFSSTDGRETLVDLTKTLTEMSQNGKLLPEDITTELVDAETSEITTQPTQSAMSTPTDTKADSGSSPSSTVSVKPEPDLLLVFGPFLKLDGYPPWHIRLTEMYCTGDHSGGVAGNGEAVEYQGFLRGLWHFAGAQMRFGR